MRFDGKGFELWKERRLGALFLRDCEDALMEKKPESIVNDAWHTLNNKAITYIKMIVSDEILVDMKGLITTPQVWEKLKTTYENATPVNQVHLMRKLVSMRLDESKGAIEHLSLSQLLSPNYKIQDYQLLMTGSKLSSYL